MFRIIALMSAGLTLAGCAGLEKMAAEGRAIQKAQLEADLKAAKIPEAQLTPAQLDTIITKLSGWNTRATIVWARAGIQNDGKLFACVVLSGKDIFGTKHIALGTGTFEEDGSFSRSGLLGSGDRIADCRNRGFDPPVYTKTTYTVIRY